MESLSTTPSRAGKDASRGRKQRCWSLFFSLLPMEAPQSSRLTPLDCVLKNWHKFDPQSLKNTGLTLFSKFAWLQYLLECGIKWLVEGSLNYNTILQLDRFCRRQGKWVEVPYMLLFFSLWDMPDLCPKGTDLGAKPSAPSCPLTLPLPLYPGFTIEQARVKESLQEGLPQSQEKFKQPQFQCSLRLLWFLQELRQSRGGTDN